MHTGRTSSAIDAEAARLAVSLASTADPAARAAAMGWAAQSPQHAIALARAETAWETAAGLRPAIRSSLAAWQETRPPRPILRRTLLTGMLAASIIGGIAAAVTWGSRSVRCGIDPGRGHVLSLAHVRPIDRSPA